MRSAARPRPAPPRGDLGGSVNVDRQESGRGPPVVGRVVDHRAVGAHPPSGRSRGVDHRQDPPRGTSGGQHEMRPRRPRLPRRRPACGADPFVGVSRDSVDVGGDQGGTASVALRGPTSALGAFGGLHLPASSGLGAPPQPTRDPEGTGGMRSSCTSCRMVVISARVRRRGPPRCPAAPAGDPRARSRETYLAQSLRMVRLVHILWEPHMISGTIGTRAPAPSAPRRS